MPETLDHYGPRCARWDVLRCSDDCRLEVRLHADGAPWILLAREGDEIPDVWRSPDADLANRFIVLTGTGESMRDALNPDELARTIAGFGADVADSWR